MGCRYFAVWVLVVATLLLSGEASSHDWYPRECCSHDDCAPADSVERRDDGSYRVTSRGFSVIIDSNFNGWRESLDGQVHVCIIQSGPLRGKLLCAFRPPSV